MENTDAAFEAQSHLDSKGQRHRGNDGERAAEIAGGGIHIPRSQHDETEEQSETTPLIARGTPPHDEWPEGRELEGLPWYRRPSIFWVLPPFFLTTLAYGGVIPPKITLMQDLICRDYYQEQALRDPSFVVAPIQYGGGTNDQCQVPDVATRSVNFLLYLTLIGGIISAFVAPHLGVLSDKYGRKPILIIASLGPICNEIISILAARNPDTFPVSGFLLGAALDGLTGSFTVSIAMANSYATDCTAPSMRNNSFAMFHASLFTGLALGPIVAGTLVDRYGLVSIFNALLGVHIIFDVFVLLVVPESLSRKRQLANRERHAASKASASASSSSSSSPRFGSPWGIFAPLKVLWPKGSNKRLPELRRNLLLLAAVDTIAFGVAMGTLSVILVYGRTTFGWDQLGVARYMSIVNGSRVFGLVIILPLLSLFFRRRQTTKYRSGSDMFDLGMIRTALFFDTLGYLGYSTAKREEVMFASGAVAALGGIGSPTLQAAITKHAPSDRTGQLLGAIGLLHAFARVIAPIVFSKIYTATNKYFPQAVFVCLTATFGLAFVISWLLRPGIHWEEILNEEEVEETHT